MAVFNINIKKLKEDSRPALYRAQKYWGKKPHNIWNDLICAHTNENDIVYDPFAGSAITFFECIKSHRKPVIADINPLTLFLVEVYSKEYSAEKIINRYYEIESEILKSEIYKKNYRTLCSNCGESTDIYNYRHKKDIIDSYSYKCKKCNKTITQKNDIDEYAENLGFWKPDRKIDNYYSVCKSAVKSFGGNNISDIWSKRNMEIISYIFDLIKKSSEDVKNPLMFAFLQMVHLTTKMCASRSEKTNRPLSTSWGRPAFMYLNNHMEQNPLIQFNRSVFGNNGLLKALESRKKYIPDYTYSTDINDIDKVDGVVCIKDSKKITNLKAKFIITDPPYGSVIQYGELSTVWNVWLEEFDSKYAINLNDEIIIKQDCDYSKYINDMTQVLLNCYNILDDNGLIIMTFNSNNIADWESINIAIKNAGLNVKLKYEQRNKRSSEANVKKTSDMSFNDFYFVMEKILKNELKEFAVI